jgi:hypothetical protein
LLCCDVQTESWTNVWWTAMIVWDVSTKCQQIEIQCQA